MPTERRAPGRSPDLGQEHLVVVCEDGAIRHAGTFAWWAEAREFAHWGHCCTVHHEIRPRQAGDVLLGEKAEEATT